MSRIRALVTDWEFDDLELERQQLASAGIELQHSQCRTPEEVSTAIADSGAQALLVQYAPITASVLEDADIGIVARYGVGVDNVDLEAAARTRTTVCNVTGYGDEEVATHAAALALAALRGLPFHDRDVRAGGWDYKRARPIRRASQLTLGVLGLGRIGREAVRLLGPFFGRVVGADPYLPTEHWPDTVQQRSIEQTLRVADVLTLHLPLTDETHHLVDDATLSHMPEGAILVNTSRGSLVDEDAVLRALDNGHLAAAAVDVLAEEPANADHPLRSHERALVTPHTAWYSAESEKVLRRRATANIVAWANGRVPAHVVVGNGF
jgi:D-3-phosphoglycerate dehydrogenase